MIATGTIWSPGWSWLRRAAPLASAVALLLAIVAAAAIGRILAGSPPRPFVDAATVMAPPPYYVDIEGSNDNVITVHRTADGHVTERRRAPRGWTLTGKNAWTQGFEPSALASARDRLFIATFNNVRQHLTGLFTFGLTKAGRIAEFRHVPGGDMPALVDIALAVSPDLRRVAIAGTPAPRSPTAGR
jgi:hypothetical protein